MQNSNLDGVLSNVNNFNFNAEHNGIQCIASLAPEDKGTARQFRFTAQMLAECFQCEAKTIRSRVQTLINTGDLNEGKNLLSLTNVQHFGYNTTTLYDLDVFNKLAMTFIDNPKAVEIRNAFNDVLVKEETSVTTTGCVPAKKIPRNYAESLRMLADEVEAHEKEIEAHGQTKLALKAEQIQHQKDNEDFCEYVDILNQKKAEISTRREATAMNTASQKSKECKRLTVENTKLTTENEELKDEVGRGTNWKQVTAIEWYDEFFIKSRDANFYSQCGRILTQISKEMGIEVGKVQETKYTKNSYYISVVDEFRNRLENGVTFSRIKQYYRHNHNLTLF